MALASDSTPGDRIMAHVYESAATHTIPWMHWRRDIDVDEWADEHDGEA